MEHSDKFEITSYEPSLDERDASIFLGRALKDGSTISAFDLRNCNNGDLDILQAMVREEILMRSPDSKIDDDYIDALQKGTAPLLTSQLNLKDKALTARQLETLMHIQTQLSEEIRKRLEESQRVFEAGRRTHGEAMKALDAKHESRQTAEKAVRDAIDTEFGEKAITIRNLVRFADANELPTEESWGVMKVSLADGHDAAMGFVRANVDQALNIEKDLEKKSNAILHDPEARANNFTILPYIHALKEVIPPEKVFARAQEIKAALIEQGGCGQKKYPNLYDDLSIGLGTEYGANFSHGKLTVNIDLQKSLEDNLAVIKQAAEDGNPKSIRSKLNLSDGTRDSESNKNWLIRFLQKEQGDTGVGIYNWSSFIDVGEENIEPTKDTWGHMTIDKNADEDTTKAFILKHIEEVRRIAAEIEENDESIVSEGYSLGLILSGKPPYGKDRELITPDIFFAKNRQLLQALRLNGSFERQDGRSSVHVQFGTSKNVRRAEIMGNKSIIITVDMNSSADEMAAYILEQARDNGINIVSNHNETHQ